MLEAWVDTVSTARAEEDTTAIDDKDVTTTDDEGVAAAIEEETAVTEAELPVALIDDSMGVAEDEELVTIDGRD